MKEDKEKFAQSINRMDGGINEAMLSRCENYGMTWGCDTDCPVLQEGECELQDSENKELYEAYLKDQS